MKKIRVAAALALVLSLVLMLAACGVDQSDVIGTWTGSWIYDGNAIAVSFTLSADGTYSKVTMKNGEISKMDHGTYELDGSKVRLDSDVEPGSTVYQYKGGNLVNNDHIHVKS